MSGTFKSVQTWPFIYERINNLPTQRGLIAESKVNVMQCKRLIRAN